MYYTFTLQYVNMNLKKIIKCKHAKKEILINNRNSFEKNSPTLLLTIILPACAIVLIIHIRSYAMNIILFLLFTMFCITFLFALWHRPRWIYIIYTVKYYKR